MGVFWKNKANFETENEPKHLLNKVLRDFIFFQAAWKQSQSKPISVSPRHCRGLKNQFEQQACPERSRMDVIFWKWKEKQKKMLIWEIFPWRKVASVIKMYI